MPEKIKVDISVLSIIKVFLVALGFVLLFWIREILLMVFISLILAATFQPIVKSWSKKVGKTLAMLLFLSLILLVISGFFYLLVPLLIEQIHQLIIQMPAYIERVIAFQADTPSFQRWLETATSTLSNSVGNVVNLTISFLGGLVSFFTIIILTIYFLADDNYFSNLRQSSISEEKANAVIVVVKKVSVKLGQWLRGQFLLGLIITLISYVGLLIIGTPYALTLAVISGILEIIPIVGPFIAGAIAALIAYSVSPLTAIIVIVFYLVIQQVENNLLVPKIMQKAIGLPPAIIIVGILVLGKLMGFIGVLLAVPILGILYVLFQERSAIKEIFAK